MRSRVLLVEDEKSVRDLLTKSLANEFDVECAADGEQALISVLRSRPDIVVTDIVMPTMDGVELVRLLRDTPSTSTIPILLTSGKAPEDLRIEGFEFGADSYLAKPYSERELRARIRALLRGTRRRDEAAQQRALEYSTAERAALLESITDAFYAVDDKFRLTYVNQRALAYFGKPIAELTNRFLWEVLPEEQAPIQQAFERVKESHGRCSLETYSPGLQRWHQIHIFPGAHGFAVNFTDVTDIKLAQEHMKLAERRKDEFVATLAHELRNPLAPIRNGIHVLKAGGVGAAEAKPVLEMMDRQMSHMVRLLDDLLDVSRISRGRLELRRVQIDLTSVIHAGVESCAQLIESRTHELIINLEDRSLIVDGDPARLAQIFANLLSNSAKYTDPGGKIVLTARRDGASAVVTVSDNGAGIPEQALEEVFEMFSQGRTNEHHSNGGLGIGLSVVRTLVQMHGGTVRAASAGAGKGSTFTVRLPVIERPAGKGMEPNPDKAAAVTSQQAALRILVVDDIEDIARSMASLLSASGRHQISTAFSGEDAISMAISFQPDLIFMDLGMPDIDGFEAARRIRAASLEVQPRIVALSGWGQELDRVRSRTSGMDDHLVKPASPDAIDRVVSAVAATRAAKA